MGEVAEAERQGDNRTQSRSYSESESNYVPPTTPPPRQQPQPSAASAHSSSENAVLAAGTDTGDSADRDAERARIEADKILAIIKAWEVSKKAKVENRAKKMHSAVGFWEDSKKASIEAKLKSIEEKLERKKAGHVEKTQNKISEIHRYAEEERAKVEAQKEAELIKIEETAAKFRIHGYFPRKLFPCFRS